MSGDREAALLETLQAWGLRALSLAWVDTVWELDFTETEALDSRFQEQITENGVEAFTKLYKCLYPFATEDAGTTENVWTLFAENELSHKALVAVLYHFIQMLESKKANVQQRVYGLHAAGLYFLLLEIPGSVANQVFHPVLFEKCMNTLDNSWPQEAGSSKKRKKDAGKSAQGDARGGKKRAKPTRREAMEMDDISEEEEDQENDIDFSPRDLLQIRETIFRLLRNFLRLLPKFSFREKPQCVMHCLQIFIGLTHFESVLYEMQFSASSDMDRMKYIPELAYRGLWLLCSPVHGEVDQTLRRLFQRILSVILMLHSGEGANPVLLVISAQVANCREQAIRFVSFLVDELKDVAFPAYRILLQHICAKFPDKSDHRTYAAEALVKLLCKFPNAEYASFIEWLYKYSRNSKMSYRVFALEVAVALLELPEREMDNSIPSEQQKFLQHKFLVQVMVFGRCSDKAPSVRSKALSCLAQCLEKKVPTAIEGVQELLQSNASPTVLGSIMSAENSSNSSEATSNQHRKTHATFKTIEVTENDDTTECDGKEVLTMLRLRAGDEKTNVRRAALQVLVNIFKFNVVSFSAEDLSTLKDRCRDPAVSVRKQALQSLTDLLMAQTENVKLQNAWLTGIVPVVIDTESTVQDKALDCLDQLMLQHVKHYSKFRLDDSHQKLAWDLLSRLNEESQELSRYLAKAFYIWSSKDKFSSTFINNLISHTETEHSAAAWMLLAKVAGSSPKLDYTRIIDAWDQTCRNSSASTSTTGHILDVIGHIAKHLPAASRGRLIDDISTWLKEFLSVPEVISPAIEALQKLCHAHASSPEETQELLNRVFGEIVFASQDHISSVVLTEKHVGELDENMLVRHLFTLGEAAQLCPAIVEKRIFLLVQSILASESMEQAIDLRDGDDLPASQPLSQPLSQFKGSTMPPIVRAHAFITLGKLCLQHEDLAKKCVPALARELEVCHDVAVRNNVIIVMCDLCVRYTTMVDRYIPNVSVCLKDSNPFIRKQTLIMLTNLLQEEFVKWKGSLFFRFISVLVDPDPDIASFAEFCLVHLLLKRNPVMFSQHFTECIFHFNCYDKHEKYNKFPQTEREKILFSLKGHDQKEKRMKIYRFLLEHFTDEQRFNLTNKISQNILANFVDGVLPLEMEANELLCDTFEVLSCKEIKLSAMRSKPGEDLQPDDDEMAMANAVMQAAQKKLISQVQKKMFIENIIPIITSLKKFLEQKRIPALRELMNYLREMMQDYRNEIKDFFAVDKQLAAELEYDMKKYEEQLAREQAEQEGLTINAEVPPILGSPQASPRQLQSRTPPASQNGIVVRTPVPEQTVAPAAMPCTPQQRAPFPASFLTPRMGILKSLSRPRQLSLSTAVILNSAKKAVESSKKMRSKSIGALPGTPSPSHVTSSKQVSFDSVNQPSSTSNLTLIGRAISTPDQTINNVTFGAGVSYIGSSHTPASGKVPVRSEDSRKEVLCMMSPDKPVPQPRQWNLASPSHRGSISGQRRSSSRRKSALKPVN